ncbi:hypothetical protein CHLRE_11g467738v5 [Chlamydomonas reinhardtii]|uniref:Uncharacterized protein n=1 Tax=Chlamydomonas reinhardtii TaxID=3055 RepID=A8JBY1_CHLRE|nr:uncharacterized protein CHLRE_11g467738v5 [Chlamydomonas reinhardtii]PNW76617.1 hypothetical protein CHLRE_11g467738v5 [Chlamydomonas reinhardtii]|eukprot:XP_001699471.1 predicted protein [Chlamydomonas reinhardtii]
MAALSARLGKLAPAARAGLTSCVVMSAGDVICQSLQRRGKNTPYDWNRTARFGLIGLTLHGPYFLWGFRMIDERFGPAKNLGTAIRKTAFGQVTLFPCYLAAFFTYITMLETGGNFTAATDKLRNGFAQAYAVGTLFWPVANVINFMFVPPTSRVLYVNGAGLVWNAMLSAFNAGAAQAATIPEQPMQLKQ